MSGKRYSENLSAQGLNGLAGGILAQLWYANAHIDLIFSQANQELCCRPARAQLLVTWKLKHVTGTSGIGDNIFKPS